MENEKDAAEMDAKSARIESLLGFEDSQRRSWTYLSLEATPALGPTKGDRWLNDMNPGRKENISNVDSAAAAEIRIGGSLSEPVTTDHRHKPRPTRH
eukprot:TRINITY_DN13008_c0_g1_i1.p1 TRINITY_DN13008_c0_g1~~TRINITY_DN13008_c0_g1_i1.p1  ORF type:complete len:113 (+),score=13.46 TRINITY_DN13008_c0_g1_i1:51-341(+)